MNNHHEALPSSLTVTIPHEQRPPTVFEALAQKVAYRALGAAASSTLETQQSHVITGTGPEEKMTDTDSRDDERINSDTD
jgi:hypothetical protein